MVVAARAPELGDGTAEVRLRDVATLLGPSLDGGRGAPARRPEPEEAPRKEVVALAGGGRSGGGGGVGDGFRVWAGGEEGEEARAAHDSGHGPAHFTRGLHVELAFEDPNLRE